MKPDEIITLLLTFLTGVFVGVTLYVMVFAPQYEADEVGGKSQFAIVGELYGGCQRTQDGCPSFRLTDDRTYQFLIGGEKRDGRLPSSVTTPIFNALTEYRLQTYAAPLERDNCQSYVDGVDYRYDITLEHTRYVIDTCRTSFARDSELQQLFLEAWRHMAEPEAKDYPAWVEGGFSAWLIERFRGE